MNNTHPSFPIIKIKLAQICNGDQNLPIKFSFYSKDIEATDKLYGEGVTTVAKIAAGDRALVLMNANSRVGTMNLDQFELKEMPGFTEYLRSGWGVNTSFAIDFTASNGELFEAGSLHKQD